jgi:hypothetical protein
VQRDNLREPTTAKSNGSVASRVRFTGEKLLTASNCGSLADERLLEKLGLTRAAPQFSASQQA